PRDRPRPGQADRAARRGAARPGGGSGRSRGLSGGRSRRAFHPRLPAVAMADPEDPLQRALGYALRHLNRRERTTGEIRAHLERKEIDPAIAEEAIQILTQDGYLNDVRYAELFAQDKRE